MNNSHRTPPQPMDDSPERIAQMMDAEKTLAAIRGDEVDALVVQTAQGERVFILTGADHLYKVMVETMNEGAVTTTSDGMVLYCNQRFATIVKKPIKTVIGSFLNRYISSKDLPLFKTLVELGSRKNSKGLISLLCGDENPVPVLLSISALQIENTPGAVCMVVTDLTEQKRTEKILAEERLTTQLLEGAAEIFVLCDNQGRIVRSSQSAYKLFGRGIILKPFDEALRLLHPDGTPFVLLSAMCDQKHHAVDVTCHHGANCLSHFLLRTNSLISDQGVLGMVVVMVDITERKLATQALQEARNELEHRVAERTVELRMANESLAQEIEEHRQAEDTLRKALTEIKTLKDQLESENIFFRKEIALKHQSNLILGESDGLRHVLYRAEQVAATSTTVLILGETGTGKGLIAAAIHRMSPRKDRPLITVNCAALPANLIESELFGREKGAYTGAHTRQIGRFELAKDSTLCLDEIGELPLEMQAKLLRVIQHNEFERLGSSHTIKVDVRILATTNRNLEEQVRKGRFREDLYYRLNVFPITVPPLRERKDDIPLLVQAFIERYARKLDKRFTSIPKETIKALHDYPWPGNIRELESVLERAVIMCPGPELRVEEGLKMLDFSLPSGVRTLEETERHQILKVLCETRWRIEGKDGAAAILGIHPSTLRARMHKLKVLRPEINDPD